MNRIGLYTILLALTWISCKQKSKSVRDVLAENIDSTISPRQDYFGYANNGWLKKNPIPASEPGWGIAYVIQDELYKKTISINENAAKNSSSDPVENMIGNFYKTAMDSSKANSLGIQPLLPMLKQVDDVQTLDKYLSVISNLKTKGVENILYDMYITQDDKNSSVMVLNFQQGGLGMPSMEYYFNTDPNTVSVQIAYRYYLQSMLKRMGYDSVEAKSSAIEIYALEKSLASKSRKLEDLRDPYANYNKMSLSELQALCKSIPWQQSLSEMHITNIDSVIIGQPEFYQNLNNQIKSTSMTTLKKYLKTRIFSTFDSYMDDNSYNDAFKYSQSLSGVKTPKPRWKRVLSTQESLMGEAVGQLFVKNYFSPEAKQRYSDMVEDVKAAYKKRIQNLTWMSDSTKQKAIYKLSKMTKKVGYPDKWKDFSAMKIGTESYVANIIAGNEWWHNYEVAKLHKPVDRTEWEMTPQTYNAYYNPSNNEIVLPAGIFTVPGMQDEQLDDALVYGYAGASTIGHEITHGFDDQGRLYNADGNLQNWWSSNDSAEFAQRAQKIISQFNAYEPLPGQHINGEATQGENIADLGGMLIGLDAFMQTKTYKDNQLLNGFTQLQRFFMGWALGWLYQYRNETLAQRLKTDVHAPAKYRVNGPVVNVDHFYEAYNVLPTDSMYVAPENRVRIW